MVILSQIFKKFGVVNILIIGFVVITCGQHQTESQDKIVKTTFRPESDYLNQFITNAGFRWEKIDHSTFRIYCSTDSYAFSNIDQLKNEIDSAYAKVIQTLGVESYQYGTHLIVIDSENEMERLIGAHVKAMAAPGHDLIFMVFNPKIRPYLRHELFHLISFEFWGRPTHRLLDEGGAMYADGFCFYENPLYSINAYFLKSGKLFKLEELISDFDTLAADNDIVVYLQSGGYFKYLYEVFGKDKLRSLWAVGFTQFEDIYGFDLTELEDKWHQMIKQIEIPASMDEQLLMTRGCG